MKCLNYSICYDSNKTASRLGRTAEDRLMYIIDDPSKQQCPETDK